ncbi:MAG TPA: hypothetical protein VIE37_01100 [Methylomirabilota bacterium]
MASRRRVYLLLLFWERLDPCARCPRSLPRLGADPNAAPCASTCRVLRAFRLQRLLWGRLVGVSFFILHPGS